MYYDHFGLREPPFRITPDTRLFFPGGNRGAVLSALAWAIANGEGIVKVVGEVGSGKTMLCRMLEQELPKSIDIVYLANPGLAPEHVLEAILFELGLEIPAQAGRVQRLHALQAFLLGRHAANRRVVLFIEEAQGMPAATLEELRLLTNLETGRDKLLQIVLFGQPELEDTLRRHDLRQLRERITYSFTLGPLANDDLRDYLVSRLRASGHRGGEVFTRAALRAVARHSEGLLRRINILADKAMLAAYADHATRVERRHVEAAARDSAFQPVEPGGRRRAMMAAAMLVLLTGAAGLLWWLWPQAPGPASAALPATPSPAPAATPVPPAAAAPASQAATGAPPLPEAGQTSAVPGALPTHGVQPSGATLPEGAHPEGTRDRAVDASP